MDDIEKREKISNGDYITAGLICLLGLCCTVVAVFCDESGLGLFVAFPLGVVTLYAIYLIVCSLLEE